MEKHNFDLPPEARNLELRIELFEIIRRHDLDLAEEAEIFSHCVNMQLHPIEKELSTNTSPPPYDDTAKIRAELFALLKEQGVGLERGAELLAECAGMILHRKGA